MAKETSLKLLNENSILFSTKTSIKPHNYDEKQLALEIDFLRKLIIIEDYFKTSFYVPEEISINDGISHSALANWIKLYSEVKIDDSTVLTAQQIKALQKRNAQLEEENLILKKAIAIFTPHSDKD